MSHLWKRPSNDASDAGGFQRPLSDELPLFGIFQNHPPGLSIQLAAHGFGAFVDEALELMGRTVEGVGLFSWRRMHWFQAHLLFELVQAKRGLSSDRIANDGGNFVDA